MRQLLWKDFRLYRSLLIFAVAVLFAIHLVAAFSLIRYHWPKMPTAGTLGRFIWRARRR